MDGQFPLFKGDLKSSHRHFRKIYRTLPNRHSDQDLTYLMYRSVLDELNTEFVYPSGTTYAALFGAHLKHIVGNYNAL